MPQLAQFFTEQSFSNLLVENIHRKDPRVVLDLGIGNGSLTTAAKLKWKDAVYYGIDIDKRCLSDLSNTLTNVNLFKHNSLDINLSKKTKIKLGSVDIAICNPPYLTVEKSSKYDKLLLKANLMKSINLKQYTSDVIFLAQNINMLKPKGILGIIVPEGIVCSHNFKLLREDLLENHSIEMCIQLEPKIFSKTEARTYILIIKKGKRKKNTVVLSKASKEGIITNKISVDQSALLNRMDYKFHASRYKNKAGKSLSSLGVKITRGNYSKLDFKSMDLPYFHTTNFKLHDKNCSLGENQYTIEKQPIIAKKGDILLARVGRNAYKQILLIEEGNIAITDCIYKISGDNKVIETIHKKLNSKSGQVYLKNLLHGVCAQVISKIDLENLKIQ